MKKMSALFPGPFEAIAKAKYIRDNNVLYTHTAGYYGGAFCKVVIKDSRFEEETLFVATRSLI